MSERWEISGGGYRATVLRAGGGLGDLEYEGVPLVVAPAPSGPVSRGRGQILVPWANRIRDGRYDFGGVGQQLPVNEVAKNNASHGLVRWLEWTCLERDDATLTVAAHLIAQTGYPWTLEVRARYELGEDGLALSLEAINRSDSAAPFAAGIHPYFDLGARADDVELTIPADRFIAIDDERSLPLPDPIRPLTEGIDFRAPRAIGTTVLDHGFTALSRDADGWAVVEARGAHGVRVAFDEAWRWVQLFTADTLGAEARGSVAIEPLSAPVDAFNSGIDLVRLEPGQAWQGRVLIQHT